MGPAPAIKATSQSTQTTSTSILPTKQTVPLTAPPAPAIQATSQTTQTTSTSILPTKQTIPLTTLPAMLSTQMISPQLTQSVGMGIASVKNTAYAGRTCRRCHDLTCVSAEFDGY